MKTLQRAPAITRIISAGLLSFVFAWQAQAAPVSDDTLASSERMLARCAEYAVAQKLPPLSIAIVDQAGALVLFKRQHGASSATADAALLKARTAARLNAPTAAAAEAAAADAPTRDAFLIMQLTTIPGGVPITDKSGQVTGAIGVSGSEPAQDAACAQKAFEAASAPGSGAHK